MRIYKIFLSPVNAFSIALFPGQSTANATIFVSSITRRTPHLYSGLQI